MTTVTIPISAALDLPAEFLRSLVDPQRLREHLLEVGPERAGWLLGAGAAPAVAPAPVPDAEPFNYATITASQIVGVLTAAGRPMSTADIAVRLADLLANEGLVDDGAVERVLLEMEMAGRAARAAGGYVLRGMGAPARPRKAKAAKVAVDDDADFDRAVAEESAGIRDEVRRALGAEPQTVGQLARRLSLSTEAVSRELTGMVVRDEVIREGKGRATRYRTATPEEKAAGDAAIEAQHAREDADGRPSGAIEARVLEVLRSRHKLRGERTPLTMGALVCDAATMGGAQFSLRSTGLEMPALLERMVTAGTLWAEGDEYALPIAEPRTSGTAKQPDLFDGATA